jgi:hypothetical protein
MTSTWPRGTFFDGAALRMPGVLEHLHVVEVFAGRDVAQRVGRSRHPAMGRIDWRHIADEAFAKTALEEDGGQRRGRNAEQFCAGFFIHGGCLSEASLILPRLLFT